MISDPGSPHADPGAPHLVFVGLAGSGKSTIARGVAERLDRPFVDLDQEIVRRERQGSVGDVFRAKGEAYFRRMEAELTAELAQAAGMVIAPGGGWVMTPGVLAAMRPVSYLIYLRVTPETAFARIGLDRGNRPLLDHPDPVGQLRSQLGVRGPLYDEADLVVDAELITPEEVINMVIERFAPG